jgi:hypothetical protein
MMPVAKSLPKVENSEQAFFNNLGLNDEQLDKLLTEVSSQGGFFDLFGGFGGSQEPEQPLTPPQYGRPLTAAQIAAASGRPLPKLKADLKIAFNEADLQNPEDWKSMFDVVVVIDKGVKKQFARIYRYGKLERQVPVSTGREKVEFAEPDGESHSLTHDTTSQTYTGYYSPTYLDIDHVSNAYRDSSMPWAVFFNYGEGEATHRSPYENLSRRVIDHGLGRRASGGCVRMHENDSRDLFWMVRFTGTEFLSRETSNRHFMSEASAYLKAGYKPLTEKPMIPKFNKFGEVEKDPATGKPVMIPGMFKTLYIVLNSDLTDAPAAPAPKKSLKPVAAEPSRVKKVRRTSPQASASGFSSPNIVSQKAPLNLLPSATN